ncbi:MAG: polysaccharide biosynthesis/export family protein [Terriglobia bacterium]
MKLHLRRACVLAVLAVFCLLAARALSGQEPSQGSGDAGAGVAATEPNGPNGDTVMEGGGAIGADYALGPEDVLTITVFNLPEMTETVRVENDGSIWVKLLGRVKAAGLTTSQLRAELQTEWGKTYLEDPHVTIFVKQYHSTPVSVVGAVARPGVYQLPGPRSLIQVIAMAGGVNMPGTAAGNMQGGAPAGRWAYITRKRGFSGLRPTDGIQSLAPDQVKVDLGRLMYSHDTAMNILVEPFDTVTVSKAGIVYVVGDVLKAGGFTLEDVDSLTALQALSLAGGFGPGSNTRSDEIIHTLPNGTRQVNRINLGKVMKGKAKDPTLTANDMLVVPGSTIKSLQNEGLGTVMGTLSGLIIWRGL